MFLYFDFTIYFIIIILQWSLEASSKLDLDGVEFIFSAELNHDWTAPKHINRN